MERWEAFVGGVQISDAFTELNDPDEQRRRFEQQRKEIERGDEEAQPYDENFIEALEVGMPDRRRRAGHRSPGHDHDRGGQPARGRGLSAMRT